MEGISARDAALAGVRLIGREPWTILAWVAINFAYPMGFAAATLAIGPIATTASLASPGALAVKGVEMFGLGLVELIFSAVLWAAAFRAFLRSEERGFFYLRVGPDEVRMYGLLLVTVLLTTLAGVILISITLFAHFGPIVPLLLVPGALLILTPLVCARFLLAPALTLDQRRFRIFGSWGLTRGHYLILAGLLLAAALVATLFTRGPMVLALALTNPHELMTRPMEAMRGFRLRLVPHSVRDLLDPGALLWRVYLGGVRTINLAIWVGISATAYVGLSRQAVTSEPTT